MKKYVVVVRKYDAGEFDFTRSPHIWSFTFAHLVCFVISVLSPNGTMAWVEEVGKGDEKI